MKIQPQVLQDAIQSARIWDAPVYIYMGTTRHDEYDARGRQTATRGDRPWWAPLPYRLLATVTETETGILIESAW